MDLDKEKSQYLLDNHLNQAEWTKMRELVDKTLLSQPVKHWKAKYKHTDACVSEVINEVRSLNKKLFKQHIVVEDPKATKNDPIWSGLKKELRLRDGITVVPLARL